MLAWLLGAAVAAPEPVWRPLVPPDPRGLDLASFTVNPLIVRLTEQSGVIEVTGEELRVVLLEHLRELGWPALGQENLLFGQDQSEDARFVLGGQIEGLEHIQEGRGWWITVRWELFDRRAAAVVYRVTTHGWRPDGRSEPVGTRPSGRGWLEGPGEPELGRAAFEDVLITALDNALARERFAGALREPSAPAAPSTRIVAATCLRSAAELPASFPEILPAVVTVRQGNASGSGVMVSPDGFVWTAEHVVAGADPVEVVLPSGPALEGKVVLRSSADDLAALKVAGRGFPCLAPQASDPGVGSPVFVVGSPLGEVLTASVSQGIVSGVRSLGEGHLVQTDAAVNPGNSGGPLLDREGRVRGIVSSKLVATEVEGVAFAVSVARYEALGFSFAGTSEEPAALASPSAIAPITDQPDPDPYARRVCLFRPQAVGEPGRYRLGSQEVELGPKQFACIAAQAGPIRVQRAGDSGSGLAVSARVGETVVVPVLVDGAVAAVPAKREDFEAVLPHLTDVSPTR